MIVNESEMKNRRYSVIDPILLHGIIFALGKAACLSVLIIADNSIVNYFPLETNVIKDHKIMKA